MKKLLRVCATGALLLGASLAAQAQGPGDATLVASDCTNLQLLRNGQSLNAVIGTQLVGDDQLTCISEGSFAVRYPNSSIRSAPPPAKPLPRSRVFPRQPRQHWVS